MTVYTYVPTPIGSILIAMNEETQAVTTIHFAGASAEASWRQSEDLLQEAARQLRAYFAGELRDFDLRLEPEGTAFQQSVWKELLAIPYGETRSYLDIARAIRKPSACRAVGAANGANPIPIVVPCHRVIGSSGALTGFGGGLDVKRRLLALEARKELPLFAGLSMSS